MRAAKLHVTHYRDERVSKSGFRGSVSLFMFNSMAERLGLKRSFNNIEDMAGTAKAMEDSGKQY